MNEDEEVDYLLNQAHKDINAWANEMHRAEYFDAGTLAIAALRRNYATRYIAPPERCLQTSQGIRVVLNGLRDISNLCIISSEPRWLEHSLAVEEVWGLSHDSTQRINAFSNINPEFISYCSDFISQPLEKIKHRFGDGLYTSWEMVSDSVLCTICEKDIRGCDHIPNRWYRGRLCKVRAMGGRITHVALLENPRDKRCRIWPWMRVESGESDETIYDG